MAGAESSPLTTHVLNTADGIPAARMALSLHRLDSNTMIWNLLSVGTTNTDGRCPGLINKEGFTSGTYKLHFNTGQYWESLGQTSFYPYVEIVFTIKDPAQRFHIPLLLSRFSYSTYRGSWELQLQPCLNTTECCVVLCWKVLYKCYVYYYQKCSLIIIQYFSIALGKPELLSKNCGASFK